MKKDKNPNRFIIIYDWVLIDNVRKLRKTKLTIESKPNYLASWKAKEIGIAN